MSPVAAESERFLDCLFEAELKLDSVADADEFLEAQAALRQQQALTSLGLLSLSERERLTALLGTSDGKQGIATRYAEELFLQARALIEYRTESCASLGGELNEIVLQSADAIRNAARHTGRERADDLNDAENLLRSALKNPLAARNAALWFDFGWVLWKRTDDRAGAEEAFYQSVRLSATGNERFHQHALRHLAHLQAAQGRGEEAFSSIQRVLEADGNDPQIWLEAARYATLAKRLVEAGKFAGRALECDPTSIAALFSEADLGELGAARIQALERITENARTEFEHQRRRWRANLTTVADLEALLQRAIPLATELTQPPLMEAESLSLFSAQRLTRRASEHADAVRAECRARLEETLRETKEVQERLRRRIEILVNEHKRWQHEIHVVEEQAESAKIPLHAFTWENPLQRARNARAKHLREVYSNCQSNLVFAEQALKDQLPALQEEQGGVADRVIELEAARRAFDAKP